MVGWTGESRWIKYAGYIGLFLAVWFLINLAGKMVSSFVRNSVLGSWDRVGGGLIGLVKGALIVSSFVVLLDAYLPSIAPPKDENSQVMPYVRQIGAYVRKAATWDLKGKVEEIKEAVGAGEGSSGEAGRK
jgi:membrane protein required for colicin V production